MKKTVVSYRVILRSALLIRICNEVLRSCYVIERSFDFSCIKAPKCLLMIFENGTSICLHPSCPLISQSITLQNETADAAGWVSFSKRNVFFVWYRQNWTKNRFGQRTLTYESFRTALCATLEQKTEPLLSGVTIEKEYQLDFDIKES